MIALLTFLELLWGCHCQTWRITPGGLRCTVEVNRCELIRGWHHAGPFAPTCSVGCGDWPAGEQMAVRR